MANCVSTSEHLCEFSLYAVVLDMFLISGVFSFLKTCAIIE